MSLTHVILERITVGTDRKDKTNTLTSTGGVSVSETIPVSSTDLLIAFVLDVSACKSFYMVSNFDLTVETNSGGTPVDTIILKAGIPYIWYTDKPGTFKLGTDVTALYITNASSTNAPLLEIEALYDVTP